MRWLRQHRWWVAGGLVAPVLVLTLVVAVGRLSASSPAANLVGTTDMLCSALPVDTQHGKDAIPAGAEVTVLERHRPASAALRPADRLDVRWWPDPQREVLHTRLSDLTHRWCRGGEKPPLASCVLRDVTSTLPYGFPVFATLEYHRRVWVMSPGYLARLNGGKSLAGIWIGWLEGASLDCDAISAQPPMSSTAWIDVPLCAPLFGEQPGYDGRLHLGAITGTVSTRIADPSLGLVLVRSPGAADDDLRGALLTTTKGVATAACE